VKPIEHAAHDANTEKLDDLTKQDFETIGEKFAPAQWRDTIAQQEQSANTSRETDGYGARRPANGPPNRDTKYGRYQLSNIDLYALGLKSGLGDSDWNSNFAAIYGIRSDNDFLNGANASEAQNAALGQLARDFNPEVNRLYNGTFDSGQQIGGTQFRGVSGDMITITKSGIAMAIHHVGPGPVKSYFAKFGGKDTYGRTLRSPYDIVETRVHVGQDVSYAPN
jgi:hypothetical protein